MSKPRPASTLTYGEIADRVMVGVKDLAAASGGAEVNLNSMLKSDLGMDEIDREALSFWIEEEFNIHEVRDSESSSWITLKDVANYIATTLKVPIPS